MDKRLIFLALMLLPGVLVARDLDSLTTRTAERADSARLEKASGMDLRARLSGLLPGLDVIEHHGATTFPVSNVGAPWLSSGAITTAAKGWTLQSIYVDGLPASFSQLLLEPIQVASVEFVTDVDDKNILGPFASEGAVYIRTRQGAYNTPLRVEAYVEGGVGVVDRMPEWSDGVTYARLNNQARLASGYNALYSDAAIAGYARGDMLDRTTPNVDYRSLLINTVKPMSRFGLAATGGSSRVRYNLSVAGLYDGDLFKVGPACGNTRINLVMGVTTKIGSWIEAGADFKGLLGLREGNRTSLYAWRTVPAIAFPVALGLSRGDSDLDTDKAGSTIYAVSRNFTDNPYAETMEGGFSGEYRGGLFSAHLDVDFGFLLKGLKSRTTVGFSSVYYVTTGKNNDYLAYYWDATEYLVDLSAHVGVKAASKSLLSTTTSQTLLVTEDLDWTRSFGDHRVKVDLSGFLMDGTRTGNDYYERLVTARAGASWNWQNRYAAAVNLTTAGSPKYAPGARWGFFPTASLTWNLKAEPFLQGVSGLRQLKVFAQVGEVGAADVFSSNFRYQAAYDMSGSSNFGPATAYQWFGVDKQSVNYTTISRFASPSMTWPRDFEFDFGVRAAADFGLSGSVKFFLVDHTGLLANTMSEYSLIYGWNGMALYENYEATRSVGGEFSLRYEQRWGDVRLEAGLTATTWKRKTLKVVNDNWIYPWQKLTGEDPDAIRGYVCTGKDAAGDLVYLDLNDDGTINRQQLPAPALYARRERRLQGFRSLCLRHRQGLLRRRPDHRLLLERLGRRQLFRLCL